MRFGFDTMREQFGQGTASPILVLVQSRAALDAADASSVFALRDRLAGMAHVTRVDPSAEVLRAMWPQRPFAASSTLPASAQNTINHYVSSDRRNIVLEVIPDDYASSAASRVLLGRVRADAHELRGHLRVQVGGETAEGVDANTVIKDRLLAVMLVMLAVIYLMLMITFRSVLLPVKAILMNLLSVGATYGVLVVIFEDGFGAGLLGADSFGYLQNFVPLLLLAILFSLSTDYEVFLLSRIREEYQAGRSNTASVAAGLARTAPLISGAALVMIAVFGAFAFTGIMPIQQLGLGLGLGIALDVTVIRLVVVPAAMKLMGSWNWWVPGRRVRSPAPVPAAASEPSPRGAERMTDMSEPVLLLMVLNFALIGLLPKIFFRRDGSLNARWWATALPFGVVPLFLIAADAANFGPLTPRSWLTATALAAVVLSVASIALIFLTVGTHRIPIALWHQDSDRPEHIVTYGAYRRIRHPFYASFIVAFLAAVMLFPHWVTLGTFIYAWGALNLTARREERRLSASVFGSEYRQYLTHTGRFFPRFVARWKGTALLKIFR